MNSEFDPVAFGRLESQVDHLKDEVTGLRRDVRELLDLASQAQGARWLFGGAMGVFGGAAGWIISHLPTFMKGP